MTTSEFGGWVVKIPLIRFDHHSVVNQTTEEEQVGGEEEENEAERLKEGQRKSCVCVQESKKCSSVM